MWKRKEGSLNLKLRSDGLHQKFIKVGCSWVPLALKVWRDHNPDAVIPRGHVIHHVDWDPLNDRIGNLRIMENGEHLRLHKEARCLKI